MRLRQFKAASSAAAIAMVRDELGHDAVILSTHTDSAGGVHITAATDTQAGDPPIDDPIAEEHQPDGEPAPDLPAVLDDHAVDPAIADRLLDAARANPGADPLAAALAQVFRFAPIADQPDRPLFLLGPPGAGKTVTAAKLAARARLAGTSVRVISTDTVKAGGIAQLEALTRALGVGLRQANDAGELRAAAAASAGGDLVVIDSVGINPFDPADRDATTALVSAAGAEPVAVLPAPLDAATAVAAAQALAGQGCRRLIATHLDMTVRLGGLLGAAHAAGLAFAEAADTPVIAGGLAPATPAAVAAWLTRPPPPTPMPSPLSSGSLP